MIVIISVYSAILCGENEGRDDVLVFRWFFFPLEIFDMRLSRWFSMYLGANLRIQIGFGSESSEGN